MPSREDVMEALFTQLQTMPGLVSSSRRVKTPSGVPSDQQPFLMLVDNGETRYQQPPQGLPSKLMIRAMVLIYFTTGDENAIPSVEMNNLLDSLDGVMAPDDKSGRNVYTIGGLVYRCWIEGEIFKDPGDLDGQGMILIPINILLP